MRQVFVGYITGKDNILPTLPLDVSLKTRSQAAFTNKDEARLREPLPNTRNGSQQVLSAFTFLETPNEKDVLLAIHELWQRRYLGAEALKIDSIGNHLVIARKVA